MLGVLGFLFQDLKVLVCSFKVAGFRAWQFSDSGFWVETQQRNTAMHKLWMLGCLERANILQGFHAGLQGFQYVLCFRLFLSSVLVCFVHAALPET